MSSRLSLGGGALRDGTNSSRSRRSSLAGGALRIETPRKHPRTALDDWRRRVHGSGSSSTNDDGGEDVANKRSRPNIPRLPPSSFRTEGGSALGRFNQRKHVMHQQNASLDGENDVSCEQNSGLVLSSHQPETSSLTGASPFLSRRRDSSKARRRTLMPNSKPMSFLSQESDASTQHLLSQLTVESEPIPFSRKPQAETVEDVGHRSQMREMEQRVNQLEQEKTELFKSKAPLEERIRQKEDEWCKEEMRMVQEIDSLKQTSRQADDLYRDLQLDYETKEEECKRLRLALLKANSSKSTYQHESGTSTGWSRHLQNDREVADLKEKLRNAEEEIASIRLAKVSLEKELHATKIEIDSLLRNYEELQHEYDELAQSTSENREAEIMLERLTTEHIATSAQLNAVSADFAATKARAGAEMEASTKNHKTEIDNLQFKINVLKTRVTTGPETKEEDGENDVAVLKARVDDRDRQITELAQALAKGEEQRRQMHNRIQELRGNIRVFVRTRPFLPNDGQSHEPAIDVSPDSEHLSILDKRTSNSHSFKFDRVFPPSAGQDIVFQEVADFVQSALDGYNVCLFSYGQTGSGKTHTMQGCGESAMRGIIPRSVEQILSQSKLLQSQKWTFKLSASFLEIYNEELKDLLVSYNKSETKKPKKLAIKRSREGKSFVDGLTAIPINTQDEAEGMNQLNALMSMAARSRSVASTKMNAQSSRSHSVFMLHLNGYNEDSGAHVSGAMNLCDLAGSERLDRSGAGNDAKRLRETQAINKSLSCLGDVFTSLAQGASHVPYRNSKLTYLLQDCLSGDGKALMFVNLSPTTASSNESLCSLRFAQRVNQVELGKATKHIEYAANH
jgi:kinesin family protein C1